MKQLKNILSEAFLIKKHQNKIYTDTVDLDLPSGLKWATCNIGANKPEDYGYYYQWGLPIKYKVNEEPKDFLSREEYTKWIVENYFDSNKRTLDENIEHKILGDLTEYRLPSENDFNELLSNTKQKEVISNNVKGIKFMSQKNEFKYIFVPYGGLYNNHRNTWARQDILFRLLSTTYEADKDYKEWVWSLNGHEDADTDLFKGWTGCNWRPVLDKK